METNDGQSSGFPEPINISNNHLVKLWHKLLGTTNVQATTEEFFQDISLSMSSVSVKPEKYTHQFERAYLQVMGAWRAMVRYNKVSCCGGRNCDETLEVKRNAFFFFFEGEGEHVSEVLKD